MEKISMKIADILFRNDYIEDSMYSIYQYGMQVALEIGCSIFVSIIISCLLGMPIEGFIFFAVFIPLRSYLGGFHMKSYWTCFICSCVTLVSVLLLVKYITPNIYISWVIIGASVLTIMYEAKRDKKLDEEGKYFYSKIHIIVIATLVACIICSVFNAFSKLFLLACTCTLVAISKILEIKPTT